MAIDSAFLDELRNRHSLVSLIGRRCKLVRSGRNWKTCCPFHGEKTPSFYIYDDHYHCFGCGAHGDAITWTMQTEGSSFPEAVERLAGEVGLEMPQQDPRAEETRRVAQDLGEVLEKVQALYRRYLYEPQGRNGLAYLRGRGLSEATLEKFGLGWSGDGRQLLRALQAEGVTAERLVQAGLMRVDEHGAPRGELFFNRVTFPIRDRRGRLVSFGGRILGDGQPKYLNGPETRLFSKRRMLFNLDQATAAARRGEALVVVEGYMDVIALDQAGFCGAVAPLGTALGEEQLELLWRQSESPILCLDGDAAGQRAALRSCEIALPLMTAERSLRFCRLEGGEDPDSLIRHQGREAMRTLLEGARPMAEELFNLLTGTLKTATPGPEERARLRRKLEELARLIPDRALAGEYRSTLLDMFFARFRPQKAAAYSSGTNSGGTKNWRSNRGNSGAQRGNWSSSAENFSPPPPVQSKQRDRARLMALCALLLRHPEILPHVELAFSQLALPEDLQTLRSCLLEWNAQAEFLDEAGCLAWVQGCGLEALQQEVLAVPLPREGCSSEETEDLTGTTPLETWWHFYGLVNFAVFEREVRQEYAQLILQDSSGAGSEAGKFPDALRARLRILEALRRGESPEATDQDLK
ncbi:DNA primase [Oecophyllibacter saccharovorans]|uniref:DNA primase n=1 Tax=Oecophyllibacter saccharovorans TaxID=2558360 RepID=A0A506URC2_9PROT|nr:DNA primase [Oecophyllibacter saccharovorans]TPW35898.1 DNA primase [Oecophyllibacter saccharovorans]